MFEIKEISQNDYNSCKKFLLSVPTINEVEDDILKDAILAYDDKEIIGCVSYETHNDVGLIRYFVFKKMLNEAFIKKMFTMLENHALKNQIKKIYCLVNNKIIEELFVSLDFVQIHTDNIYIDEQHFSKLNYKDSHIMVKELLNIN